MNKTDLADALATRLGITKIAAVNAVTALFDPESGLIVETIRDGEKVSIQGFGTFSVTERAARTGVNPATGAPMDIPAKKAVKFSVGKNLKGSV